MQQVRHRLFHLHRFFSLANKEGYKKILFLFRLKSQHQRQVSGFSCTVLEVTLACEEFSDLEHILNEVNSNVQWQQHLPMWSCELPDTVIAYNKKNSKLQFTWGFAWITVPHQASKYQCFDKVREKIINVGVKKCRIDKWQVDNQFLLHVQGSLEKKGGIDNFKFFHSTSSTAILLQCEQQDYCLRLLQLVIMCLSKKKKLFWVDEQNSLFLFSDLESLGHELTTNMGTNASSLQNEMNCWCSLGLDRIWKAPLSRAIYYLR